MYKRNKNKQERVEELEAQLDVSHVIKSLQLSEKDMEELNSYLEQNIHRSTDDSLSKIFADQKLTISQKMFLSYIRGGVDSINKYVSIQKYGKFFDLDAAEEFANNMYSSDTTKKIMRHTLDYFSKIMELNIEDVKLALEEIIDKGERKRMAILLENIVKNKELLDESIKEWEIDVEARKEKIT